MSYTGRGDLYRLQQAARGNDGSPRLKPGPKTTHPLRKEFHLKFPPEMVAFIEKQAQGIGYQSYFEGLVKKDQQEKK